MELKEGDIIKSSFGSFYVVREILSEKVTLYGKLCDCIVDCFCNKREKYPNDVFLYLRCISKFDCDFITLLENQNIIDNIKRYYQTKTYRKFQKKNEEKFKNK